MFRQVVEIAGLPVALYASAVVYYRNDDRVHLVRCDDDDIVFADFRYIPYTRYSFWNVIES